MAKLTKLSIKQRKFVKHYVETSNGTQSALHAYNTKSVGSAHKLSKQALSNPMVVDEIEKVLKANGITLEGTTNRLKEISEWQPDKISSDTVLKANIELVKLLNGYNNKVSKVENKSISIKLNGKDFKELVELHKIKSSEIEDILGT